MQEENNYKYQRSRFKDAALKHIHNERYNGEDNEIIEEYVEK